MGPEKRLPLALFLCFLVLVVLQLRSASETAKEAEAENPSTAQQEGDSTVTDETTGEETSAGESGESASAPDDAETATAAAQPVSEVEAWDEWVEFGAGDEIGHMHVRFSSFGGSIAEIRLADYFVAQGLSDEEKRERENMVPIVVPAIEAERTLQTLMLRPQQAARAILGADVETVHWEHELTGNGVEFTHRDTSGVTIVKRIEKVPGQYNLNVTLSVTNDSDVHAAKGLSFGVVASVGMAPDVEDGFYPQPKAIAARLRGSLKDKGPDTKGKPRSGVLSSGNVEYFGTHNKYFAALLRPENAPTRELIRDVSFERVFDMDWARDKSAEDMRKGGFRDVLVEGNAVVTIPAAGKPARTLQFVLFAGPKDPAKFAEADEPYERIIEEDLGFFDGIAGIILGFMRFLHGLVGNWGWAIILLTLTVRMLLFPLNRRMQTSMARHATKMKRVQPKIDAVKRKYEKDPKKLREEQAKIFQSEGVMPPLGGCLPLFLQIPIFFGLFSALRVAIDLRQEPFLGWITDLSQPDRLAEINFDTHLPFIGTIQYFNLLPILMVVMWVGQQKVMPKPPADNEQARQMQKIMMWMPIMFGFFLYNYAAGLSLYMMTTSMFGIIEMTVIRRIWPIDDTEQPKKPSRFLSKLEEIQKQAMAAQEAQRRQAQAAGAGGSRKRGGKRK